jgi:PAS domain S-box-containing protein
VPVENRQHNQTEESIEERERLQRLILENAPVGIFTVEPGGRIHSVNPQFCNMLGFTADELRGRAVADMMPAEDLARVEPLGNQLLQGAIPHYDTEGRFICKDGTLLRADIHVNLVRDSAGEAQLFVGQAQDITSRMAEQEQQHRREQLLRLTFENAPIGMGITDEKRQIRHANPALCTMLGYSKEELESLTIDDITHPDDAALTDQQIQGLWSNARDNYMVEKRFLRRDGGVVNCQSYVSLVRDEYGAPLLAIGQVVDITERVRAAREMQGMRTYLKNMIDSMPSMLVAVDGQGLVTQWNMAAEQTTGIAAGEAVGRQAGELLPLGELQRRQIAEAIDSNRPVKAERMPVHLQGEERMFDILAYPLLAADTEGAVIRLDDVTDRVRMQEMMVQTEKMLSVGGLAAGMAHEINNPLGAILQSCQNIKRRLSDSLPANREAADGLGLDLAKVHDYLCERRILQFIERIQEAGERASKIVGDMLSFSRRSALHREAVDLAELMEKSVRLASSDFDLKREYDIKQVAFERDYDPALGTVECDRTQIEQVILNLIVNAAHAMALNQSAGLPPKIVLRTRLEGDFARLEVIDNGPGMEEQTRRRIFEPFFTTKELGIGTGLGLSVSYFIVCDQHKGSMQVESAPGKGARFIIHLPLRQG